MRPRTPQLALRLDAAARDDAARWRAGAAIVHLGVPLTLVFDTDCAAPERRGDELHLPLPPGATPRQIRDAAESWQREAALALFARIVAEKSAPAGRRPPHVTLAFGKRGDWVRREGDTLRCHWQLGEQPPAVIAQVLEGALAATRPAPACDDLFAFV